MNTLKPCPFCGKAPRSSRADPIGATWVTYCDNHNGMPRVYVGTEAATQEQAETLWNQRAPYEVPPVVVEIAKERIRQIGVEGFNGSHDAEHSSGSLARAGAAYALLVNGKQGLRVGGPTVLDASIVTTLGSLAQSIWPWDDDSFKPKDARRNLVRAAALIVAEIERMDRAAELKAAALGDVG